MSETFLYKKGADLVEVKKTGRVALKTSGTRRQKEDMLYEIMPVKLDLELGNWSAWVTEDQLYSIQQGSLDE